MGAGDGGQEGLLPGIFGGAPRSPYPAKMHKESEPWPGRVRCSADNEAETKPLPIPAQGQKWKRCNGFGRGLLKVL